MNETISTFVHGGLRSACDVAIENSGSPDEAFASVRDALVRWYGDQANRDFKLSIEFAADYIFPREE